MKRLLLFFVCMLQLGCGKNKSPVAYLSDGNSIIAFQKSEFNYETQFTADFNGSGCKMWLAAYNEPPFYRTNRNYSITECTSGYREEGYYYQSGLDLMLCKEHDEEQCRYFAELKEEKRFLGIKL